jgi:hypothetical protein
VKVWLIVLATELASFDDKHNGDVFFKVLKNGTLPQKRPLQIGIGSGRYRFCPF